MWNGTTPSLKAMPDTRKTRPKTSTILLAIAVPIARATCEISSVPVAP